MTFSNISMKIDMKKTQFKTKMFQAFLLTLMGDDAIVVY